MQIYLNSFGLKHIEIFTIYTHNPSSFTISARMAGVDLAFLFSSTEHKQMGIFFQ